MPGTTPTTMIQFGTGKLGDLAEFTSAIVLAMIALLIGYEAVTRLFWPVPIHFSEAIPIAVLGLIVNVASVLLLSGGGHHHNNGHSHAGHEHQHDQAHSLQTSYGPLTLEIFEDGVPPRFRSYFPALYPPRGRRRDRDRAPGQLTPGLSNDAARRLSGNHRRNSGAARFHRTDIARPQRRKLCR